MQTIQGSEFTANKAPVTVNSGSVPGNPAAYSQLFEGGQALTYGVQWKFTDGEVEMLVDVLAWQTYELRFWANAYTSGAEVDGCYENIIGLSQTDCECSEDNRPIDYNVSKSGLYLDELQPIGTMGNFENCQGGGIWAKMQQSISEAVKIFKTDMKALVLGNHELRRQPFKGTIGEASAKEALTSDKDYTFCHIMCNPIRSGVLRIKNIGTVFTATGTVTAYLYDNLNQLITTLTLNTTANQHRLNTVDIELPMLPGYVNQVEYFLVIAYNGANRPKLNPLPCGCGGRSPYWRYEKPMYNEAQAWTGRNGWGNWIMLGSGQTDSLVFDRENREILTTGSHMNGITLEVEIGCKLDETFCLENFDFATDPLAMSTAFAIYYGAAMKLADKMLRDPAITRQNTMNRDELYDQKKEWAGSYNEMVRYIAQNVNLGNSDCYTCKNDGPVIMGRFS